MTQLKIKIKKSKLIRKIEGEKVTGYYGRVVSTGKKTFEEVAMESAKNTTLHVLSPLWPLGLWTLATNGTQEGGGYKAGVAI